MSVGTTLRFDPGIVGRALTEEELAQLSLRIVGVLEPVTGMFATTDIWVPDAPRPRRPHYNQHSLLVLARLADGRRNGERPVRARPPHRPSSWTSIPKVYTRAFVDQFGFRTVVHDARAFVTGTVAGGLWLLQAATAVLLAVAWAVAANLLLARVETGRRDLAVRAAPRAPDGGDIARHYAAVGVLLTVPAGALRRRHRLGGGHVHRRGRPRAVAAAGRSSAGRRPSLRSLPSSPLPPRRRWPCCRRGGRATSAATWPTPVAAPPQAASVPGCGRAWSSARSR